MISRRSRFTVSMIPLALCLTLILPACGGDKQEAKAEEAPKVEVLDKASNGSPVAVRFDKFVGEGEGRGIDVVVYNHGDKQAAGYILLFRYFDGAGNPLKAKAGTPFEKDSDFITMSGNHFYCEPGKNATIEVDGRSIGVPADAAKVEVVVSQVKALAADGKTIEDWWSQEDWSTWPASP